MKKLIFIAVLTLLISNCGDKVREEITERYDDGKKKTIMKFKGSGSEEVMVERIVYSKSGDTLFWEKPLEDFYYEKVREEITERYDDGKKKTIMKFVGEGSEEVMVEKIDYSQSGDTLMLEKPLEKMKMVREYHKNGKIKEERNYKDGKRDGKLTLYHENGQIRVEGNLKDENADGKRTTYYEDGQIESEGNYKDGKEDGKWIRYYEDGQIESEGNYKDGKEDGKWIRYYENGQIKSEGNYKDGKIDGKYSYYNEDGSIDKEREITEIWDKAIQLRLEEDLSNSVLHFQSIISDYSNHDLAAMSQFQLADIYLNDLMDFEYSVEEFKKVISQYPKHDVAIKSLFMTAYIYNNYLDNTFEAKKYYELFLKKYPYDELIPSVKYELESIEGLNGDDDYKW